MHYIDALKYGYHVGHDYLWQLPRHAVDVFFVISGFVIHDRASGQHCNGVPIQAFCTALSFPSVLFTHYVLFHKDCWTIRPCCSPGLFRVEPASDPPKSHFSSPAVYWTLALEAEFYLLVAASFWLFRERFRIGVLAGTLVRLTGRYMGFFLIGMSAYFTTITFERAHYSALSAL